MPKKNVFIHTNIYIYICVFILRKQRDQISNKTRGKQNTIYTWSTNCKGSPHKSQRQDLPEGKFTGSNQAYMLRPSIISIEFPEIINFGKTLRQKTISEISYNLQETNKLRK